MSVQQQIDRISTEVSAQETLLDQALAAIANKAAGGGGVPDTCTVTMGAADIGGRPYWYVYTALDENGNISYQYATGKASNSVTLEKVVCNSILSVSPYSNIYTAAATTNATMLFAGGSARFFAFQITATAGETATITFEVGSGGGND